MTLTTTITMTLTTTVHLYLGLEQITEAVLKDICKHCFAASHIARLKDLTASTETQIDVLAPDDIDSEYVVITLDSVYGCNSRAVHNAVVEFLISVYPGVPIVSQNDVTGAWHIGKPYVEEE